jgi:hypothetical protein
MDNNPPRRHLNAKNTTTTSCLPSSRISFAPASYRPQYISSALANKKRMAHGVQQQPVGSHILELVIHRMFTNTFVTSKIKNHWISSGIFFNAIDSLDSIDPTIDFNEQILTRVLPLCPMVKGGKWNNVTDPTTAVSFMSFGARSITTTVYI